MSARPSGEVYWKRLLAEELPNNVPGLGLSLQFVLPAADEWKLKADIDNFCEPVFSALISRKGWLGRGWCESQLTISTS